LLANKGPAPAKITAICNLANDTSILPTNANADIPLGNDYTATLSDGLITITKVNGTSKWCNRHLDNAQLRGPEQ